MPRTISLKLWLALIGMGAVYLCLFSPPFELVAQAPAASPGDVVINEVAWGGSAASAADEWIELLNTTSLPIALAGWGLASLDGTPAISLTGTIPAGGYYLLERSDEDTVSDIPADLLYTGTLDNGGESLRLVDPEGSLIDSANLGGGPWPAGSGGPDYYSMERVDALLPDTPDNWASNNGITRNGLDADGNPLNGTPKQANSASGPPPPPTPSPTPPIVPPPRLLISEFVYDGTTPGTSGDEFVELCNAELTTVDLTGFKVGDEESPGGGEGMGYLPAGRSLAPNQCLVIAKNATQFAARFGFLPDLEMVVAGSGYTDHPAVPNLARYTAWASGNWALADDGDEILVLDPSDRLVDSAAFRNGDYTGVGVSPAASAPEPDSLQRIWPYDTDSMPDDFVRKAPNPGQVTSMPSPPASPAPAAELPLGMRAYWGTLHSHSSYSDGAGPPALAFATARANGLHFLALTDHGHQLSASEWSEIEAQATQASLPGEFVALRGYEYTHPTDGHITVWNTASFASRDDPDTDTLPEFYAWLAAHPEALAEFNHPFASGDFRDFSYDPAVAPLIALLEVGNGSEIYSTYHTFEAEWMRALATGWLLAPANNSDAENAYWGADTRHRTGLVAPELTEGALLEAMRARRAFASEDPNLALALRSGETWMGSAILHTPLITLTVNAVDLDPGGEPVHLTMYDRTVPVASAGFEGPSVAWTVTLPGQPGHFYWVRALQADGDVAQTAPLWVAGTPAPEAVMLNEALPAPGDVDWDGDGSADYRDEWVELYNAGDFGVGLGGWQLQDESGMTFVIPLEMTLAARSYGALYRRQTGLALNNDADSLTLRRPDGALADTYAYGDGPGYDISLCRLPDGTGGWHGRCEPTPGSPNRALPEPAPAEVSIYEARHMAWDSWVSVRGRITVPPGVFGERTAYLQDATGGIKVYLPEDHRLWAELGDRWKVTGHTHMYYGELEIEVSERQDVHRLGPGDPPPPLPIGTGVMVEPYEGTLVMLSGWAVDFERGGHFWADDGTGWARVYLDRDAGIRRPWLEVGQPVQAVGVVSQYLQEDSPMGGYRLMPRYAFDLIVPQPATPPAPAWPQVLPETGQ